MSNKFKFEYEKLHLDGDGIEIYQVTMRGLIESNPSNTLLLIVIKSLIDLMLGSGVFYGSKR